MSLQKVHLRKLLQLFYASDRKRISLLREDIRNEINKRDGSEGGGGDFFGPFWADAKDYVAGGLDLTIQTQNRIEKNKRRRRLYPRLRDGFLSYWNEKRRWINEPFAFLTTNISVQYPLAETSAIVRVENVLAVTLRGSTYRIIYPYFCEDPALQEEAARLGLWLLSGALSQYPSTDIRILDILRGKSYSVADVGFKGSEQGLFISKYKAVIAERKKLEKDY